MSDNTLQGSITIKLTEALNELKKFKGGMLEANQEIAAVSVNANKMQQAAASTMGAMVTKAEALKQALDAVKQSEQALATVAASKHRVLALQERLEGVRSTARAAKAEVRSTRGQDLTIQDQAAQKLKSAEAEMELVKADLNKARREVAAASIDAQSKNSMRRELLQAAKAAEAKTAMELAAIDKLEKTVERQRKKQESQAKTPRATSEDGQSQQLLQALSRFGGPAGEITARLAGGAGMEGALGRVALAAGLAGVAWKAFNLVVEAGIVKARIANDELQKVNQTLTAGQKTADANALSGLNQEKAVRRLIMRQGEGAVQEAQAIAQKHGMDFQDAAEGLGNLGRLEGSDRARAIMAAIKASNSGEVSFSQAASMISGNDLLQGRLRSQEDPEAINREVAARVVMMNRGGDVFQSQTGAGWENMRFMLDAVENNKFIQQSVKTRGELAKKSSVARAGVESGQAFDAASKEVAAFANPIAAAMNEMMMTNQKMIDQLDAMAKENGKIREWMANITSPEGGFGTQATRRLQAQSDALNQMPVGATTVLVLPPDATARIIAALETTAKNTGNPQGRSH